MARSYTIYNDVTEVDSISGNSPSDPLMGIEAILTKIKMIQNRYPKRWLCGSMALILYDAIYPRRIHDLDFVMFNEKVVDGEAITLEFIKPFSHCLFLSSDAKIGEKIKGVRLQDLDQILYWKKIFGRDKDIKDLKKYDDSQFITLEDMRL